MAAWRSSTSRKRRPSRWPGNTHTWAAFTWIGRSIPSPKPSHWTPAATSFVSKTSASIIRDSSDVTFCQGPCGWIAICMWSKKNSALAASSRRTEDCDRAAWQRLRIYRSSSLDPSGIDTMRYLENVVLILGHRFMSTAQHEDIGEMDTRTTQNSAPRWLHLPAPLWLALLLLVNAATTLLLYFLTLALSDRLAAWIAATTFALLSTSSSVMGFAAHATHFVALPAILGM